MSFDLQILAGDLTIQNGALGTVVNSQKLIQDILKICLTPAGSNPLQPWYGSFINRSLIGSPLSSSISVQIAQSQLQSSIQNLMTLQQQQIKSFQVVSPDEQINSIAGINITRNMNNLTEYIVQISVISKGFLPVTSSFTVSTI